MNIKNLLYGIIIGIAFVIPGVSGAVIATILGLYDEVIYRLNHFFQNFKNNILYITPLLMGIIISIIIFSKVIIYLLNNNLIFISYLFIGLIIGSIPSLINEIKKKTKKNFSFIPFLVSLLIGIILFFIEKKLPINGNNFNPIILIIAGFFYAIGKIVPGISGASLLMLLGVYKYFLSVIANPLDINIELIIKFIPFIVSFIISAIIILHLIEYLLKKYFLITYSVIIGFAISSVLFIYPNYFSFSNLIIVLCSSIISYFLCQTNLKRT